MIFRWYFGFPKFSEVTIFHHEDYWLRRILFKNTKTIVTIPALPYFPVFLSFSFLFFFLKEFLKNKKKITKKSLLKKIYYIYIISVFDYSKTKIIVTFIDNSGIFHNLNNIDLNKKRKYFAIQNGTRHKSCAKF